jgi:hypothetical protein
MGVRGCRRDVDVGVTLSGSHIIGERAVLQHAKPPGIFTRHLVVADGESKGPQMSI